MSPWTIPLVIEGLLTGVFCAMLAGIRHKLGRRALAFWTSIWVARGAATLIALRYIAAMHEPMVAFFGPLLIAFALALAMLAIRTETQSADLKQLNRELDALKRQAAEHFDRDPLTGLLNRSALTRWIETEQGFRGVIAVCDLDDFKVLNDYYGHLVGDEILSGVGKLIRTSIRDTDLAFRWGGDEFVIFFRNEDDAVVEARMRSLEERLRNFQIRKHGPMAVRFSWGVSPAADGRGLRESLAEADRRMYDSKRDHRSVT